MASDIKIAYQIFRSNELKNKQLKQIWSMYIEFYN